MNEQIPFKPGEWVRCINIDGFPANAELTEDMAYQVTSGSQSDMIYVENDLKVIVGYFPHRFVLASHEISNLSDEARENVIDMLDI